jgi:hypothetical protein
MNRIAAVLQRDGVRSGDAIAICAGGSINPAGASRGTRSSVGTRRGVLGDDPIRRWGVKAAAVAKIDDAAGEESPASTGVVKLFKSLILLVPPPWLEQGTSRSTLSWTEVSDHFYLSLELANLLANSWFSRTIAFWSFPAVSFRWRFGGDLSGNTSGGKANQTTSRKPQAPL